MKNRPAKTRAHRVLFDADLPFRGRSEPLKTRYNRRAKHAKRRDHNDE
jgi:hypothetical protein